MKKRFQDFLIECGCEAEADSGEIDFVDAIETASNMVASLDDGPVLDGPVYTTEMLVAELDALSDKSRELSDILRKSLNENPENWIQQKISSSKEYISSILDFYKYGE